jgi:PelA/Pel-15E family pectate lyase
MKTNHRLLIATLFLILFTQQGFSRSKETDEQVKQTMKTATRFMMEKVSYQGGFVWNYLPDFSRSWGELEAKRTMIWIQPPGTPTMGHTILDAYYATKDNYYYDAALKIAKILIKGQLPCGGWNYMFDLAGEDSLKNWYETIGKNAWRLEEFQHYYGNATFDDGGTMESAKFLLRLYMVKKDPTVGAALNKTIRLVLDSQYPVGGWPQRYPVMKGFSKNGTSDYSGFITLNDDVLIENIDFLTQCYQLLKREDLKAPILKAMYCCKNLQQGEPYAGWADQYTMDLKPAHARSYEPRAVNTGTTSRYILQMMDFYKITGDTAFLSGIPAAIRFLDSQRLPDSMVVASGKFLRGGDAFMTPRFVDPDSGKPLFVHRKGSNVVNGMYYVNQDIRKTIGHYSSQGMTNTVELRRQYEAVRKLTPEEATRNSPFRNKEIQPSLINASENRRPGFFPSPKTEDIISSLNKEGYWPSTLFSLSNSYIGPGPAEGGENTSYAETMAGDKYDTSCNRDKNGVPGISTSIYESNMGQLIHYLTSAE